MANARSRRSLVGILDAAVIDGGQRLDQAVFDRAQFAQRQAALVELAVEQPLHGDLVDQALDARGRRLDQRAAGALHGVGQHQHGGLLGLRLGAGIAEGALVDLAAVGIRLRSLAGRR